MRRFFALSEAKIIKSFVDNLFRQCSLDIFIRQEYKNIFIESVKFCQKEKGLLVGAWCIMTSHIHLAIATKGENKLEDIT